MFVAMSALLVLVSVMFQAKGFVQHLVKIGSMCFGVYGLFCFAVATAHAASHAVHNISL